MGGKKAQDGGGGDMRKVTPSSRRAGSDTVTWGFGFAFGSENRKTNYGEFATIRMDIKTSAGAASKCLFPAWKPHTTFYPNL